MVIIVWGSRVLIMIVDGSIGRNIYFFEKSLLYVPNGRSRLWILQHCHEMPLVGYFRDFGISFSKLLVAFIGLMLVVGQSVLDIHHMGYSNSYQYPIVQGSLSLWTSLPIFHISKVLMLFSLLWIGSLRSRFRKPYLTSSCHNKSMYWRSPRPFEW